MLRCLLALACLIPAALHAEELVMQAQVRRLPLPDADPAETAPAAPALPTGPRAAVIAALADARTLLPEQQQHSLYLDISHIPEREREAFYKVVGAYHVNCLSRKGGDPIPAARPSASVLRVDARDYGWDKKTLAKLKDFDPYFRIKVNVQPAQLVPVAQVAAVVPAAVFVVGKNATARGAPTLYNDRELTQIRGTTAEGTKFPVKAVEGELLHLRTGVGDLWGRAADFEPPAAPIAAPAAPVAPAIPVEIKPGVTSAAAPWLPQKEIAELISLTQSEVPILRADWFFVATARQVDRNNVETGAGYYDFLRLKTEKDLEDLAGLDRAAARRIQREIAAIVADSGVALNNRQVFRFGATSGGYWETIDADKSQDNGNALRLLDGDFKGQAKEVFGVLPNRLFFFGAVNIADGKLQATVPDKIAADRNSTSNDLRIHTAKNCITCHQEGLRPIDDWARTFYADPPGDAKLQAADYEKIQRLKALYLTPMEDDYEADQLVYARTLRKLTGWKPAELARNYARVWHEWAEAPVSSEQLARELGVSEQRMKEAFASYAKTFGSLDPVLVGYLKKPAFKARREHVEEVYVLAQAALMGIQFADAVAFPKGGR